MELPIAQRIEFVGDFKVAPHGDNYRRVVKYVLEPYIVAYRDLRRPRWLGTDIDHVVDQEENRRYSRRLLEFVKPKLTSDIAQLATYPTTDNMEHHGITPHLLNDKWQRSFYEDIVELEAVRRLATAREKYINRITAARLDILNRSAEYARDYRRLNRRSPDIVGLFYYFHILAINEVMLASHDTVATALPAFRQLFVAHELPVGPYLTSPAWFDWQGFPGAQAGALAMIKPLVEGELVGHYHRAVRYNWRLTAERRSLLEFARERHVVRDRTLESVFDAQPPALLGRFLAFFRRLRMRRPPTPGSLDDFLMQHSKELEALQLVEPLIP
jgi:hypothetical protein